MAVRRRKVADRRLTAVIVNFRTATDTLLCIETLVQHKVVSRHEDIVVVDNMSGDGSAAFIRQKRPDITLIESPVNAGFGSGVNLGVENSSTEFVLILNPDTRFIDDSSIENALKHFDDPDVGIVGLSLRNDDGSDQHAARTFYSLATVVVRRVSVARKFAPARTLEDEHFRVGIEDEDAPWVIGAGFIVRRECFAAIGGMDEKFFLYMEDVDLCRRMWRAGYKVKIAHDAILLHTHRRESGRSLLNRRSFEHLRSLLHYTAKYGLPLLGHDKL